MICSEQMSPISTSTRAHWRVGSKGSPTSGQNYRVLPGQYLLLLLRHLEHLVKAFSVIPVRPIRKSPEYDHMAGHPLMSTLSFCRIQGNLRTFPGRFPIPTGWFSAFDKLTANAGANNPRKAATCKYQRNTRDEAYISQEQEHPWSPWAFTV